MFHRNTAADRIRELTDEICKNETQKRALSDEYGIVLDKIQRAGWAAKLQPHVAKLEEQIQELEEQGARHVGDSNADWVSGLDQQLMHAEEQLAVAKRSVTSLLTDTEVEALRARVRAIDQERMAIDYRNDTLRRKRELEREASSDIAGQAAATAPLARGSGLGTVL